VVGSSPSAVDRVATVKCNSDGRSVTQKLVVEH